MPVPSAITDLSATAASNSPAGTEAPSVLDDHQRAQGAFIRQLYDLVATASGSLSSSAFSTGNLAWTGTLTGGTGVVNIGSGQVYKDSSGNVGVGTASPAARLHAHDPSGGGDVPRIRMTNGGTGTGASDGMFVGVSNTNNLDIWNFEAGPVRVATNNLVRVLVDSSGNTGVGTSSPAATLHVAGSLRVDASTSTSANAGGATALPASPAIYLVINVGGTNYKFPGYLV